MRTSRVDAIEAFAFWIELQEVRERAVHLAAIWRCAGQGRPESRRAFSVVGWDRYDQNQAQAVVPEGFPRGTRWRISCLLVWLFDRFDRLW